MAAAVQTSWTAETFLAEDQETFGSAWRYELVDGEIIAHAAPAPDHGAIHAGLVGALTARMQGRPEAISSPCQTSRPRTKLEQ